MTTPFNPADHLIKLKNKAYLEVKWRLLWLQQQDPAASIRTELLDHQRVINDKTGKLDTVRTYAIFRAWVELSNKAIYFGHGMEELGDFGDYLEKAETKAIGRALAAAGFGTQFVDDMDMGTKPDGSQAVVDAPVERPVLSGWGT